MKEKQQQKLFREIFILLFTWNSNTQPSDISIIESVSDSKVIHDRLDIADFVSYYEWLYNFWNPDKSCKWIAISSEHLLLLESNLAMGGETRGMEKLLEHAHIYSVAVALEQGSSFFFLNQIIGSRFKFLFSRRSGGGWLIFRSVLNIDYSSPLPTHHIFSVDLFSTYFSL